MLAYAVNRFCTTHHLYSMRVDPVLAKSQRSFIRTARNRITEAGREGERGGESCMA